MPSGALMKAMLVASGQKMLGTFTGGAPANLAAQPYPNLYDGFGRIQLNHVLFADDTVNGVNPGERLLIVDGATATLTQGESQVFIVSTAASDPILGTALKVVLVWTDPPGQPQVNNPLINNLDLTVEHGGTTCVGRVGRVVQLPPRVVPLLSGSLLRWPCRLLHRERAQRAASSAPCPLLRLPGTTATAPSTRPTPSRPSSSPTSPRSPSRSP